jgi:hypothetical protein
MKNLKNFLKNPYGNMIVFALKTVTIGYILLNVYTFIAYGAFVPLIALPFVFLMTAPAGLSFVAINQYYKKKFIKEIEKVINETNEPMKSQLNVLLIELKNK